MNRIVSKVGFACLVSLALVSEAAQANTTTHGVAFHAYNASETGDIDYFGDGVRNIGAGARNVIGPVGFHPPAGWAGGNVQFFLDGTNAAGKTTSFTLTAYNWNGTIQSSVTPNSAAASYDLQVGLNNLSIFSYISLLMSLPNGGNSVFRGVTAVQ